VTNALAGTNVWLHRFAVFTACAAFCLIVAGALVTSNEAGLAVPDWPLSYGSLTPPWVGNIRYEHGHRMVATFVGLLTVVLALWLWRREERRWVRRLGWAALGAVVVQGLLGGMTVLFLLPPAVSIAHACLAQGFFALVVTLALVTGPGWRRTVKPLSDPGASRLPVLAMAATAAVFAQLALGASLRHKVLGIAPHLAGAAVVVALGIYAIHAVFSRQTGRLRLEWPAGLLAALLAAQLLLGLASYMAREAARGASQPLAAVVWITVAHVAAGAVTLAASLWLSWEAARLCGLASVFVVRDYLELTKPSVTWLILMSAAVGFYVGSPEALDFGLLLTMFGGTALVASGTAALNQWMERDADGRMRRTASRPLPGGRLEPRRAFWFGLGLAVAGIASLAAAVNLLTAGLAAFTCASYLFAYTPLKSRTTWCTLVGAFPGAMPILIGWTGARNELSLAGWILYGLLFLWQFPHFHAIATLYREDYQRAGILMLPTVDAKATGRQIIGFTAALVALSAVPSLLGVSGNVYLAGALALGAAFFYFGWQVALQGTRMQARRLLQASVFYLPLVYGLLVIDKL